MAGDPVQDAYDRAAAVFSRSFELREWKFVGIGTPPFAFGDAGAPRHKAVKKIDREKWIYVFGHAPGEEGAEVEIREEIRVDKNGEMSATPHEDIEKDIGKRRAPAALGKTMCLPRRVNGTPRVYRFFASRVRLPLPQIKDLKKTIVKFAPRTVLDPGQRNTSVVEEGGKLLVPVVDPVTVALHLHAAFVAAADDVVNYTAAHPGLSSAERGRVGRRRKKQMLGKILKGIIGDHTNVGANNLVHRLKGQEEPLSTFLIHYDRAVQWRVERRDRHALLLRRWLSSDAMRIAEAAAKASGKDALARFLVPWSHSITRLDESPEGRRYLNELLDDKVSLVHTYVWPGKELSDDSIQVLRKGGLTFLEAWKTLAEARTLAKGVDHVSELVDKLRNTRTFKQVTAVDRTIRAVQVIDPGAFETKRLFGPTTGMKTAGAIIEAINLVLTVNATKEKMRSATPEERELALKGLLGSSLDAASAVGQLMKNSDKVVAVFSFVSGVIDVYLGLVEMKAAVKAGDMGAAVGSFFTVTGSAIGTGSAVMTFFAVPGAQVVGIIGLAVVSIGYAVKELTRKDLPLEKFFSYCTWGEKHDDASGWERDWSPTRFEEWRGEKEFDNQLEALLHILCTPEGKGKMVISRPKSGTWRDFHVKQAWLPPTGAKFVFRFKEEWKDESDNKLVHGELFLTPTDVKSKLVEHWPKQLPGGGEDWPPRIKYGRDRDTVGVFLKMAYPQGKTKDHLEKVFVKGWLEVTFDGKSSIRIPWREQDPVTLHPTD